jgi:hypothetical protein
MLQGIVISYLAACYGTAALVVILGVLSMFTTHRIRELTWKTVAKAVGVILAAPVTVPTFALFVLTVSMIDFHQSRN